MLQAMSGRLEVGEEPSLGALAPALARDSSGEGAAGGSASSGAVNMCGPAAAELRAKLAALQGSNPAEQLQRSRLLAEFFCCPSGEPPAGCGLAGLQACDA
jgi:hypothetical protein